MSLRYQLFDIKLVIRKVLVYSAITICITAGYLIVLLSLQYVLRGWSSFASTGIIVVVAVIIAWTFNPLRLAVQKGVDRLFYGERYYYRQTVLTFSHRMSNVLDLEELAEAMLQPLTKAVRASQVSLLLPNGNGLAVQSAERLIEAEPVTSIKFLKDSPIVAWLTKEDKPLSRELIDVSSEFKVLGDKERKVLEAAKIELLCPMKRKHKLIGILAVSKKQPRGFYTSEDVSLLMTVAHDAAEVIENAQLYAKAKDKANTDELTGLFNHRYFHQRLDDEIARCSRFGHAFSLILLDLDLFKAYNDVHGHLAGDEILKQVAHSIKGAVRRVDIAFRYGGDEFALILPQTSLDNARNVAERIHNQIEEITEAKGIPLSCSIGIAGWPNDGAMREEIIHASDTALYYAKQTGRNRICMASEMEISEVLKMGMKSYKTSTLSTIYALAATVDAKDHHTYGHSRKVSKYATDIAKALGCSEEEITTIRAAALLHDIGKIGISDRLLKKTEPLTPKEWEPIRNHPNLGVAILKHVDGLKDCLAAVQYHHERYDGTGYPRGLKGNNIPLDARIMAVADAYDAMTSTRPYRRLKYTHEQALYELERAAGTQFDPKIVKAFVDLYRQSSTTPVTVKRSPVAV